MALQPSEVRRGEGEVSLAVIVEADQCPYPFGRNVDDFPGDDGSTHRAADDVEVLGQHFVVAGGSGGSCNSRRIIVSIMAAAAAAASTGFENHGRRITRIHGGSW